MLLRRKLRIEDLLSIVNSATNKSELTCDARVLRSIADVMWDNEIDDNDSNHIKTLLKKERERVDAKDDGQKRLWMLSYEAIYTLLEATYKPKMLKYIMNEISSSCYVNLSDTDKLRCVSRAVQAAHFIVYVPMLDSNYTENDVILRIRNNPNKKLIELFKGVEYEDLLKLHISVQLNCDISDIDLKAIDDMPKSVNYSDKWRALLCGTRE